MTLERWGVLRFENAKPIGGGRPAQYVLLNEDQCYAVCTYSRNLEKAMDAKDAIVDAFGMLRRQATRQARKEWIEARKGAAIEATTMCRTLQVVRESEGKETKAHHYMNEHKLVNWVFTGVYGKMERDLLSQAELRILWELEIQNAVLLGAKTPRNDRKVALKAKYKALTNAQKLLD